MWCSREYIRGFNKEENIAPNIVFVDPPRRGLDKNTIDNILKLRPEKVIYISCNPATMVRDINMMEGEYQIKEIQPVDMFPYTSHVECVAVLKGYKWRSKMNLREQIKNYKPYNEQEEKDKQTILKYIDTFDDVLTRNNEFGHLQHHHGQ